MLLQVFNKRFSEDVHLVDETQIVEMLEMYKTKMSFRLVVGVFNTKQIGEGLTVYELPSTQLMLLIANTPKRGAVASPPLIISITPKQDVISSPPPMFIILDPDIFDNLDEYVGVDDELLYNP